MVVNRLGAVDRLLAGYLLFLTALLLYRGHWDDPATWAMLVMHGLFAVLLVLFTRLEPHHVLGSVAHDLYPILMLLPFYAQIGFINAQVGPADVYINDALVQRWEAALFGGQISYTWIRQYPSVFWSGILHFAYLLYYPIVIVAPIALVSLGRREAARFVILATMLAFVACYLFFVLFPVAGPNYTFEWPTGAAAEVWSARLVYRILDGGSSFGAAFPSSHVAATVAATLATIRVWRPVGISFVVPAILLTVGTVYCQMHYGIDATSGIVIGGLALMLAARIEPVETKAAPHRVAGAADVEDQERSVAV